MQHILFHELKYYFKNSHELVYIYGFYFLIILIIPMGLRQQLHVLPELAPSIVWLALISSITLGAAGLFQRDAESGVMELYQQLPQSLSGIVFAKWLAFYLASVLPLVALTPLILGLFGLPMGLGLHYGMGIAAGGACVSILASLAAAITIGLERARAVVLLMVIPLAVPAIVFGAEYLRHGDSLWQSQLLFLVAFSIFLLPIYCLCGAACIRASN